VALSGRRRSQAEVAGPGVDDRSRELEAQGIAFNNVPGQCWPIGQPLVMARVWPIHMVQLPTAIIMVSNFDNRVRWIHLDGREHTDPDIHAPAYQGESTGPERGHPRHGWALRGVRSELRAMDQASALIARR
jgi:hypothetical protein